MLSNQIPCPGPTISSEPAGCSVSSEAPSSRIGIPLEEGNANSRHAPSTRSHVIATFESTAAGTASLGAATRRTVGARSCCARSVTSVIAQTAATTNVRGGTITRALYNETSVCPHSVPGACCPTRTMLPSSPGTLLALPLAGSRVMPPSPSTGRVKVIEEKVEPLERLPARIDNLEAQILQFREEVRIGFSGARKPELSVSHLESAHRGRR